MKVIITEEQLSIFIRRRYHCMKDYIEKLKSGENKLSIPPSSFKWDTYKYIFVSILRHNCGESDGYYNPDYHDEIMGLFGDELYQIYKNNK